MWYKLTWMYIWQQKVRPSEWKPWANTIAYYPLESDANDYSWNGYDWVAVDVTYTTLSSWKNVWTFNGSTSKIDVVSSLVTWSPFTLNIWAYKNTNDFVCVFSNENHNTWAGIYVDYYNQVSKFRFSTWAANASINVSWSNGVWYNRVFTYDWTTAIVYKDWTVANSSAFVDQVLWWNGTAIWYNSWVNWRNWLWYLSEIILEDKARTAQEIQDYYDQTKWDYWIS